MIELPTEPIEAQDYSPKMIILAGLPKNGKSTIASKIPNNLIVDLDDGYRALSCMKIKADSIDDVKEIAKAIRKKTKEDGKAPYKYITIDNSSRLEEMCMPEAIRLYQATPMGASYGWKKNPDKTFVKDEHGNRVLDPKADIRTLPNGSGYYYVRMAINNIIDVYKRLATTLILVTHIKEKSFNKDGADVNVRDIDLAGKTGVILAGLSDAIGLVYRENNKTIISFKNENGAIWEARPLHLRGKEFTVIESDADNNLTFNLKPIFGE